MGEEETVSADMPVRIERCDVCIVGAGNAGLTALLVASQYLSRDQKIVLVDRRERAGEHRLGVVTRRVQVEECFGWTLGSHRETNGGVRIAAASSDGQHMVVEAKLLIKACGLRVTAGEPLDVASGREVNLVAGSGGGPGWWRGSSMSRIFAEVARRFDGTNEREVTDWMRVRYGAWLTPETGNFSIGLMSEAEKDAIAAGMNEVIMDHLAEFVDRGGRTKPAFRSGATRGIAAGSSIPNCTGHLDGGDHVYEPYVSESGLVLSINARSAALHSTSYAAYFLTHLLFLGKITQVPLFELDLAILRKRSNAVFPYAVCALAQHNLSLIYDAVPARVFLDGGPDTDRRYPLPRHAMGMARFLLTHRRERVHQRRALDTVRWRFDVRCGPLRRRQRRTSCRLIYAVPE